ncbi:hypothetical protein ColTof4_00074 [Colletotrichum tofieldiae]|uniref:Uncharacterized protein n=1 Tax=Colletotrichum tofieldiae TaxID=708197 RepID=A0A161VYE9_9PEZI|nr:hypothetical protein CT0861_01380 [Colletotrichum tofieldiae]GKT59933.1 hypothetical protein ColTof3_07272 [Colletotrichum tofieldiae]GKT67651.1 hypothetical protein ColTof4_00074 [Colletotrichum tofieldiae]GKT91396.1 hypothetical protein Ct61P_09246 [Colletotrichum tofieldiae]
MKSQHIALPGLQAAAIAFLAARTTEAKVFCSSANNEVVADTNCDGKQPAGTFFRFGSETEILPVGSLIDAETKKYDAADVIDRQNAQFPPEIISGGFGKRQCDDGGNGG